MYLNLESMDEANGFLPQPDKYTTLDVPKTAKGYKLSDIVGSLLPGKFQPRTQFRRHLKDFCHYNYKTSFGPKWTRTNDSNFAASLLVPLARIIA